MCKRIVTAVVVVLALAVAVLFTAFNPDRIEIDLGFVVLQPPLGLAFVMVLAGGWLIGILSTLPRVLRLINERRRLRSELRRAPTRAEFPVADERS